MFFKYGINMLYIILFFSFGINKGICIYLPSGINSLNKFLYLSRISKYNNQTKTATCSLSDGPNCYFTENRYTKNYIQTNNENKNNTINNEWVKFYSKIPENNYKNILHNLSKYSLKYINSTLQKSDKEQNPKNQELNILMTFDDSTTKKDMYLERLTNIFYNEKLIADFQGKLKLSKDDNPPEKPKDLKSANYPSKLYGAIESDYVSISFRGKFFVCNYCFIKAHYDDNTPEKPKDLKSSNYPSKLYGTIESDYVSISFRGKFFVCNYCFIKAHNDDNTEEIQFYGYLGEKLVFGYSYTDDKKGKEKWILVTFPEKITIDKFVISGPYDIDNISFTFQYKINADPYEVYYNYNHLKKADLIENNDI